MKRTPLPKWAFYALALCWIFWGVGIALHTPAMLFSITGANFLAGYSLWIKARNFSKKLRPSFYWLATGLGALGIADFMLAFIMMREYGLGPMSTFFYVSGAIMIAVGGISFPLVLEDLGLRPVGHGLRIVFRSLVVGFLVTFLISKVTPIDQLQFIFAPVSFAMIALFGSEMVFARQLRLRKLLESITGAFCLAGVARLASLFMPGFDELSIIIFGFFWLSAMSIVILGEKG